MHLFRDCGMLLNVVKCPSASKITQLSKYQQFYQRRHLVVTFHPTPTSKMGIVSYPLWEFQIIEIRYIEIIYSKPHPNLCSHGRVLQHEIIIQVHIPPLVLFGFGFDDLQYQIRRLFASINTSCARVFLIPVAAAACAFLPTERESPTPCIKLRAVDVLQSKYLRAAT